MTPKTQPFDSLERFLADSDRYGLTWWLRRALWSLIPFFYLIEVLFQRLRPIPGAEAAGVAAMGFILILATWGVVRLWLKTALDRFGFGLGFLLPSMALWWLFRVLMIQASQSWILAHALPPMEGMTADYWTYLIQSRLHDRIDLILGIIMVSEGFLALFRMRLSFLKARESALRARLAPHFLFNTLNALHAQIEHDPRAAQATTEKLAALFRQVVELAYEPTVPLAEELTFVERYLSLEKARYGERLAVEIAVPEELEQDRIPPLSLQVLVENAIKHGVAPLEQGGLVRIGARREGRDLWVWVDDPGTGCSDQKGTGTALETLRLRLEAPEHLEFKRLDAGHRAMFRWRQAR